MTYNTANNPNNQQLRRQARDTLRQFRRLRDDVNNLERKIQRLSAQTRPHQPITAAGRGLQAQQGQTQHSQADKTARLCALKQEFADKTYDLEHIEQAFEDMSSNPQYVEMLRNYYGRGESAIAMADKLGYSERQFYRLLGRALELFGYHYMQ